MGRVVYLARASRLLCRVFACAFILILPSDRFLPAAAQETGETGDGIEPGEAYVTRFSGTKTEGEAKVIDPSGIVGSIIDVRGPGQAPQGHHWLNEKQRLPVTAADVGQVFGIAFDDADPPNIYLSATSAFGLHRSVDGSAWMAGQWGAGGGPGTIWKLDAANAYKPVVFAQVALDGRQNSGASLGSIAYDRKNRQLLVSDLETGMIHRLKIEDGSELGRYDHGTEGRASFIDAATGAKQSLPAAAFDPASTAKITDCPEGAFTSTPSCWNYADFRRRVWGLGLRKDDKGEQRLFYAVWSSQGFGKPDFAEATADEKRNSVWSIAIGEGGDFDRASVRREYFLPDFFLDAEEIKRAGASNPVSDIEFPECTADPIMLAAERGGVRNLGLTAESPFAFPHEARVLRFELDPKGVWQPIGRYDVGYYDRKSEKPPHIRANASGGADFGFGYTPEWTIDASKRNDWVWLSGDFLCSPEAPCFNPDTGKREDGSEVHGIQGTPQSAFDEVAPAQAAQPYPATGEPYPPKGPQQSWMIDEDQNVGPDGTVLMAELARTNATEMGDVEIYEPCDDEPGAAGLPPVEEPPVIEGPPDALPPPILEPPLAEGPDLEKRKDGPAQCLEGGICTFTITITNLGPGIWSGPLMELDTLPPGARLIGYAPQPEWRCNQGVGTRFVDCYHDFVTLLPGQSVPLIVDVLLPVGLVGRVENCIEDTFLLSNDPLDPAVILAIERALNGFGYPVGPIDGVLDIATQNAIAILQADSGLPVTGVPDAVIIESLFPGGIRGGDINLANDRDCHIVDITPLPPPPPAAPPDIEARKLQRTTECRPDGQCIFELLFINRGPGPWTGRPELLDTLPPGATLEAFSPPWLCAQAGVQVTCRHPLVLTLAPGDIRQVAITVRMPPNLAPGAQNCVDIVWPPGVRDPNPGNDRMCIPIRVAPPRIPDIEARKVPVGAPCAAGQDCQFELWFTNRGPGAWTGRPTLTDVLPPGATFKSASAPWTCTQAGGELTCEHPDVTLPAMQSLRVTITLTMPATIPAGARNCARVKHPPGYADPVPGNDESCVGLPPSGPQPPPPPRSEKCNATVKAGGDKPEVIDIDLTGYQGTAKFSWEHFNIKDRMKVIANGQVIHDTQCVGGTGTKDFPIAGLTSVRIEVEPNCDGTSTGTQWEFKLECPTPGPAGPAAPPGTPPAGLPDFEMKKSQTTPACTPGSSCSFEIQLINKGPGPWTDSPELIDTLPPGATFESASAPWTCKQTGGRVHCKHPRVQMPPGNVLTFTITAKMPGNLAHGMENCIEILWGPHRDHNPINDRMCIPIKTTPQPPPQPPAPPRAEKCNETVKQGGDKPEVIDVDLGGYQGTAKFSWEHFTIKDRMRVTGGGQLIHDTQCVGFSGAKDFSAAGLSSVRVEVEPNCAGGTTGTQWEFKIECPAKIEYAPKPPTLVTPPLVCPHGTVKQGDACVEPEKPAPTPKKVTPKKKKPPVVKKPSCPSGYYYNRRTRSCVPIRVTPPVQPCPYGTIRIGQLCVRIQIPQYPPHGGGGGGGGDHHD